MEFALAYPIPATPWTEIEERHSPRGVGLRVRNVDMSGESPAPKDGFVQTAEAAIKIAVAIWEPIYGAERISQEKPYHAGLTNGIWTVQGSLPANSKGGVAEAYILKEDGRILLVSHGK